MRDSKDLKFSIIDDSGILAVADAETYNPFVSENWTYIGLKRHFKMAMAAKSLLVWECGDGGDEYRVVVRNHFSDAKGFREITGAIEAKSARLHLVSYTALTMAAQFADEPIPNDMEADLAFEVDAGTLGIRIVQMFDPTSLERPLDHEPHFILEWQSGSAPIWTSIGWETDSDHK